MPNAAQIQALVARGMAKGAAAIGEPFALYRPTPGSDVAAAPLVATVAGQFSQNYNFNRAAKYDDVLWNGIVDSTLLMVGDVMVGATLTYFVASLDPLLPVSAVRCNGRTALLRAKPQVGQEGAAALPSQEGGTGHYFGQSRAPQMVPNGGPGEVVQASNVPVLMIANAGRATGSGSLPDDAPGPSRWRFYTPASVLPKGSILNRDKFLDDEGHRYEVSAAQWTEMGYRSECIRLEM